jgi:hypothetical protein
MIVRILGEGQLELPDSAAEELNRLDAALESAVEGKDEAAFRPALAALLAKVRQVGAPDASMDEVHKLLTDEGLIPG